MNWNYNLPHTWNWFCHLASVSLWPHWSDSHQQCSYHCNQYQISCESICSDLQFSHSHPRFLQNIIHNILNVIICTSLFTTVLQFNVNSFNGWQWVYSASKPYYPDYYKSIFMQTFRKLDYHITTIFTIHFWTLWHNQSCIESGQQIKQQRPVLIIPSKQRPNMSLHTSEINTITTFEQNWSNHLKEKS